MTDHIRALHEIAYTNAMIACAQIELAALQETDRDKKAEILGLIEKYGIHHNAVVGRFQDAIY